MFLIHLNHGAYHVNLTFRIYQRHQLVQVAVSIPQGIYRVTVVRSRFRLPGFHGRIFPVHVLKDIRMNQRVIQGGIEHGLLFLCSAFHHDAAQIIVPQLPCAGIDCIKSGSMLFGLQILAGILYTDKRYSHGDFYLFVFFRIKSEPRTNVVTCQVSVVLRVQFIFAVILVPFRLYAAHLAL